MHETDTLINTTNWFNVLPPMNTSSTITNGQNVHIRETKKSDIATVPPDFTTAEGLRKVAFPSALGQTNAPQASKDNKSAGDRYAALKDLDDMFKTTVMSEGMLYSI